MYSHLANVFHEVEKDLKQNQAKKATKFQQKKAQIKFNTLKRQRNEVLARLYVISSHIGKHDIYFVDDPTGNTSAKEKDKAQKIELAKMATQALVHEEEQRCAQEQAKKEKQRKGKEGQGGHGTGKTGNLAVNFSRQGKHREFSKFNFLHRENCGNTGKILKI